MGIQTRPTDSITVNWAQFGMPYVEFAKLLTGGGYGPYRSIGVVASAAIAPGIDFGQMTSSQSSRQVVIKEFTKSVAPVINVTTRQHSPDNLQLIFVSISLTEVSGGTETATDEQFQLTDDEQDFLDLDHQLVDESTVVVSAAPIADEAVGTGNGTLGGTLGDFSLDFKQKVYGDITAFTVGGVSRLAQLENGTTPSDADHIAIPAFATDPGDANKLIFGANEIPANGAAIVASYEPSHAFVLNTDFGVDPKHGRIRMFNVGASADALSDFQMMEVTYDYEEIVHHELVPWTQLIFEGRVRVRMLGDQGINKVWVIPSTSVRPTSDPYEYDDENPAVANLAFTLLDNGTSAPYGTMELYGEESYS